MDANFALLIRGTAKSEAILFSVKAELLAPEFMLAEFSNHRQEILAKTHRSEDEFDRLLSMFERRIKPVPQEEFKAFIPQACEALQANIKDAPYVALALKCQGPIWSEDKALKEQSAVEVLNTEELYERLFQE